MDRLGALIVDDHPEWCRLVAEILVPHYLILGDVQRGDQVLDRARELVPNIVTLDISMPGTSGLLILPGLRTALPEALIVVVTANQNPFYVEEAFSRGADAYIFKGKLHSALLPTLLAGQKSINSRTNLTADQTRAFS